MRKPAAAISAAALLLLFTTFPVSFSQRMSSDLFVGISRETINLSEAVSVTISMVLEPHLAKDMMLRFVSPQGSVQSHQLTFQADSLGFASGTVDYPNGGANASTQQPGNYTILVQDMETGALVGRASFQVVEPKVLEGILSFLSDPSFVSALILGVAVGSLTYLYNRWSADRETEVSRNDKKAEEFLRLTPLYNDMVNATNNLSQQLRNLKEEEDYQFSFYHLIEFFRTDDRIDVIFLSDVTGERLFVDVKNNIFSRIREKLEFRDNTAFGNIISGKETKQTFTSFAEKLNEHNNPTYILYEKFKVWINSNEKEKEKFIEEVELFANILNYEIMRMFEDWYPRKEGVEQELNRLKGQIENKKRELWKMDTQYDFLKNDPAYANYP